jgi:phosphoribosylaminoimidazolecarboxamide formyltransferase/IMP cyclohydrolase
VPDRTPIRRALVSVYDKTGLDTLAAAFREHGVSVVSTGRTADVLRQAGVDVTVVSDLTGFPECLDGRVKTLHPTIHAGLLADQRRDSHRRQLTDLGIEPFDLVVANLYPFAATIAAGATIDEAIEQIDIGGPTMIRAAAKNNASLAVITDPARYDDLVVALEAGGFTEAERARLARDAFIHTATYDTAVATWMSETFPSDDSPMPPWAGRAWEKATDLRYGENSHQAAALYRAPSGGGLAAARQHGGKEMSYNNYVDTDAAMRAVADFMVPAVAIIKHSNPCGIAVGADIAEAHRLAHATDPVSAFGGVIAANRPVTLALAEQIAPVFTEVVVAPSYEPEALALLQQKKNLRLLEAELPTGAAAQSREIFGGMLLQQPDLIDQIGDDPAHWELKAGPDAGELALADLTFAWRAVRSVKSNAILLAHDGAAVGIGMGQVNRVDSCRLAVERAGERAAGSVAASDAFFPFADGPAILIAAGVSAIVEPGGSIRDEETIAICQEANVSLYFTGVRHFFH